MKRPVFNPFFLIVTGALVFNPMGFNIFELPKIHFLAGFLGISIIYIITGLLRKGKIILPYNKYVFAILGVWVVSLILSTVFSTAPELSFWGSYNRMLGLYAHLIFIGIFIIFLEIFKDKKAVNGFFVILLIIGGITAIIGLLQQFGVYGMSVNLDTNEYVGRSFSTLGHPSFFGQFLLLPIWGGIYLIFEGGQKNRDFFAPLTLILILALALTQNRASIFALLISLAILVLISKKIKPIYKGFIISLASISFIGYLITFAPSLRSLGSRLYLWRGAVKSFFDNPIAGSGLETFEIAFQKHFPPKLYYFEHLYALPDRAHNEWLDLLVTQGVIGFIAYSLIVIGILYTTFKKRKKLQQDKILFFSLLALMSLLISNFFSFPVTANYLIFISLIAIIVNRLLKISTIKLKLSPYTAILSGALIILSILICYNSFRFIYADTLFARGYSSLTTAQVNNGMDNIEKALEINPHQGDLYLYFGDTMVKAAKEFSDNEMFEYAEYINTFGRKFFNNDFRSTYYFAKILQAQGKITEAENAYIRAESLAPDNAGILRDLGRFYYENKNYKKAHQTFEKFFNTIPNYWQISEKELEKKNPAFQEEYRLFFKHAPDIKNLYEIYKLSYKKALKNITW